MPAQLPLRATPLAALCAALLSAFVPSLSPALQAQQWTNLAAGSGASLTGVRSNLPKDWLGLRPLSSDVPILVMPGHADSQGFGSGASGEAVSVHGARPMDRAISDELFWNLAMVEAVVRLGLARGLNIRAYDPGVRSIASANDPRTTWSVGRAHVQAGGYAVEIHHDAHGAAGVGSGLIPPIGTAPSRIDESLAAEFGAFPRLFRDGLGAPRRGIAILEIGKLEGRLEAGLRNPISRAATIDAIAQRVVTALERGLSSPSAPVQIADLISPPPDVADSAPPAPDPQASPEAW